MLLRTIIFFVVLYFLIKIVSRLFLPSKQERRKQPRTGAEFFYSVFDQMNQNSQQQRRDGSGSDNVKQRIDNIEEAEYEEIKEEDETGKSKN